MAEENKTKEEKKTKKEKDIEKLKQELKEELKREILEEQKKNENVKTEEKKEENKSFEEKAKDAVDKIMDTEDNTSDYDKKDIETNKIMAILAYFGPLSLIPFLASKESKFAMYHAKQGLNLFIIECAVGIVSYFLSSVFQVTKICNALGVDYSCGTVTPLWITIPINFVQLILGIIALIGLIYACQGKAKEVPILGKIKVIK